MTKAELARRLAWRFKVIQQAGERSRNIARTCRHVGIWRHHGIRIVYRTDMPVGASAYASWKGRRITIPPIKDEETAALAYHEIAHILAGDCPNTEPHRRDPAVEHWWSCLQCEVLATTGAMTLVKKCPKQMYDRLAVSLKWYLQGTPAPANTRARARELTAPLAFYSMRRRAWNSKCVKSASDESTRKSKARKRDPECVKSASDESTRKSKPRKRDREDVGNREGDARP